MRQHSRLGVNSSKYKTNMTKLEKIQRKPKLVQSTHFEEFPEDLGGTELNFLSENSNCICLLKGGQK